MVYLLKMGGSFHGRLLVITRWYIPQSHTFSSNERSPLAQIVYVPVNPLVKHSVRVSWTSCGISPAAGSGKTMVYPISSGILLGKMMSKHWMELWRLQVKPFSIFRQWYGFVWKCRVLLFTQWFCWSWHPVFKWLFVWEDLPYFQTKPYWKIALPTEIAPGHMVKSVAQRVRRRGFWVSSRLIQKRGSHTRWCPQDS